MGCGHCLLKQEEGIWGIRIQSLIHLQMFCARPEGKKGQVGALLLV